MTDTLPPLPEPDTHCHDDDTGRDVWSHSAEQLRAYAAAAVAAEREACAFRCAEIAELRAGEQPAIVLTWRQASNYCADAIRARKP